jgi:hypothetical protein
MLLTCVAFNTIGMVYTTDRQPCSTVKVDFHDKRVRPFEVSNHDYTMASLGRLRRSEDFFQSVNECYIMISLNEGKNGVLLASESSRNGPSVLSFHGFDTRANNDWTMEINESVEGMLQSILPYLSSLND